MEFSTPQWDSTKNLYRIRLSIRVTIKSEPFYLDISGQPIVPEAAQDSSEFAGFLQEFIPAFCKKDAESKWFSSRLKESSVLKKLSHVWSVGMDLPTESQWCTASWQPSVLEIHSTGFQLCWGVTEFLPANPQISSRFIAFSEAPTPRPESPNEIRQVTLHSSDELEAVYDIPFTTKNTALDLEEQERDRRMVQEARLRLALAKLKSERVMDNYYRKYGDVPAEDVSDLSEDEASESS
jgi:hypothetical protein